MLPYPPEYAKVKRITDGANREIGAVLEGLSESADYELLQRHLKGELKGDSLDVPSGADAGHVYVPAAGAIPAAGVGMTHSFSENISPSPEFWGRTGHGYGTSAPQGGNAHAQPSQSAQTI